MKGKAAGAILTAAAVIIGSAILLFAKNRTAVPTPEAREAEACGSCTARHQNLKRLRDARSSEEKGDE